MTLRTPDTIKDGVAGLMADVGPLHTVSGFAFDDADPAKVEDNLRRAGELPGIAWLDLRREADNDARALLARHAGAATLVLVLDVAGYPSAVAIFLRQARDGNATIDLGQGEHIERPSGQSVIVVAQGLRDFAEAPFELQRIDIWDTDRPRLV